MPTRGCFVCHVHCLVHDGVVRSSPCRPHHENFGRNLYHMFVPAYFASQFFVLFWVVVFELLQSQMLIPYFFQAVFSYFYVNTNPSRSSSLSCQSFSPVCFSSSGSEHFNIRKIQSQLSQWCSFIHPKLSLFYRPPSLVFFKDSDFLIEYPSYWCQASPFFSFNVLIRWCSWRF